jgi:glycosyltransferase involved in cell wall biosynthesis
VSAAAVMEAVGSPTRPPACGEPPRTLRVAQVITRLSAGAGGITLRGALALDQRAYATTILTSETGTLLDQARTAGLEVVELKHLATGRGIYPTDDRRAYLELVARLGNGRFDLVHTHSAKAGALGRLAARRVGVPAVVHSFHGFPFHGFQPALIRRGLVNVERRLGRLTDFFLADGTMVAAEAVRLRLAPPDRIRAIASPIADEIPRISTAARQEARQMLGLPHGAVVIGTCARLDGQKAPLDMVRAIAALGRDDIFVVWCGDGPLRDKTERSIARAGLTGRFVLLGERSDVLAILPAFDVFALSSLFEGLPCSLVEAMACGIPVVATAVNSVPEIVISGKTGLLARPADPESLAQSIGYMLEHPAEAARMAVAARGHVGDRFRPDVHALDLIHAYEHALRHASERNGTRTARVA